MSDWIRVEDRLPVNAASEMNGTYFACEVIVFGDGEVASAIFSCGRGTSKWWYAFKLESIEVTSQITHWMPLPEPPQQ